MKYLNKNFFSEPNSKLYRKNYDSIFIKKSFWKKIKEFFIRWTKRTIN